VNLDDAVSVAAQQVCGLMFLAEPETRTSTSPQQALARPLVGPRLAKITFAEKKKKRLARSECGGRKLRKWIT